MSFADIKKNKVNNAAMKTKIQDDGSSTRDPRQWKHRYSTDSGIGTSLIRFLPRYDADGQPTVPWVAWTEFSFKNGSNSYWNRNLSSINKPDPVSELNKAHWAKIPDAERKNGAEAAMARKRKVQKKYITNIVVLDDKANPENNGKVMLYQFGPAILKKLEAAWFPKFEDQKPLEFFDWDQGANFRIRSENGDFSLSYDSSEFEQVSPLAGGRQEVQEKLYNSMYDLAEFESESNYKSYDELKAEMIKVLGGRYVAKIMDEEFNPEVAAKAGANPFEKEKQSEPQSEPQTDTDVLANITNTEPELDTDVFANITNTEPESQLSIEEDPFANQSVPDTDVFSSIDLSD